MLLHQAARERAGLIAHQGDGLFDRYAGFLRHIRSVVDHTGDRLRRDITHSRNVSNRRFRCALGRHGAPLGRLRRGHPRLSSPGPAERLSLLANTIIHGTLVLSTLTGTITVVSSGVMPES